MTAKMAPAMARPPATTSQTMCWVRAVNSSTVVPPAMIHCGVSSVSKMTSFLWACFSPASSFFQ